MRIATWNVNGIRARNAQVIDWIARDRPDVVCLQEIKAKPDQLPPLLFEPEGYWCHWHGGGGYSGVAIFVHRDLSATPPVFVRPAFDFETRLTTVVVTHSIEEAAFLGEKILLFGEATAIIENPGAGARDTPAYQAMIQQLRARLGALSTLGPAERA